MAKGKRPKWMAGFGEEFLPLDWQPTKPGAGWLAKDSRALPVPLSAPVTPPLAATCSRILAIAGETYCS